MRKIKESVLNRIRSGELAMRPKWHFVLKTILATVGAVIVFLAALYLVSFIVFTARQSGAWFGPAFGSLGFAALLRSLPWTLILLSLVFVGVLEILARRYAFAYRRPLLYSVAVIIVLVLAGGAAVAPFHRTPFRDMPMHRLPVLTERFYRNFGPPPFPAREFYRGTITESLSDGFVIEDFEGATTTIRIPPRFPLRRIGAPPPAIGDEVVVFGAASGTEISARGIRVLFIRGD